jgi:hypothetical protein
MIPTVSKEELDKAVREFIGNLEKRIKKKGSLAFNSEHEALGKLHEELMEFQVAVHGRQSAKFKSMELYDIAIAAIWGAASYKAGMKEKKKK